MVSYNSGLNSQQRIISFFKEEHHAVCLQWNMTHQKPTWRSFHPQHEGNLKESHTFTKSKPMKDFTKCQHLIQLSLSSIISHILYYLKTWIDTWQTMWQVKGKYIFMAFSIYQDHLQAADKKKKAVFLFTTYCGACIHLVHVTSLSDTTAWTQTSGKHPFFIW